MTLKNLKIRLFFSNELSESKIVSNLLCFELSTILPEKYRNFFKTKIKSNNSFRIENIEKVSTKYVNFLYKRVKIEKDSIVIKEIISHLDIKKKNVIRTVFRKIKNSFELIFATILPTHLAKISLIKRTEKKWIGIKFKIFFKGLEKKITELSGGQKSVLSFSFIISLVTYRSSPFYILDEIDSAMDSVHSQNLSKVIFENFKFIQFIIVSLKKQIILNAEVVFEIKKINKKSIINILEKK